MLGDRLQRHAFLLSELFQPLTYRHSKVTSPRMILTHQVKYFNDFFEKTAKNNLTSQKLCDSINLQSQKQPDKIARKVKNYGRQLLYFLHIN
jgi:hypothetical protein